MNNLQKILWLRKYGNYFIEKMGGKKRFLRHYITKFLRYQDFLVSHT